MTTATLVIIVGVVVIAAILAWYIVRVERTKKLRSRFGPEYTHAIQEYGNQTKAEDALLARQRRRDKLQIRPLSNQERDSYAEKWLATQSQFVNDPIRSIQDADLLVGEVMTARGYPMSEFEDRADDLSVDYPHVVRNYRAAHAIALRRDDQQANTEELRKGIIYYRDLFDELLEVHVAGPKETRR